VSSANQVADPVKLSVAVGRVIGDAFLALAPHHEKSAAVVWLFEEEQCFLSAAASFDRAHGVVPNVAVLSVAAGFQVVAVALQAADGTFHNPMLQGLQVVQCAAHGSPC
jgi:hypothetical protein